MTAITLSPQFRRLLSTLRGWRDPGWMADPFAVREVRTSRLLLRPYGMQDGEDWRRIEDDEAIRRGLDWPIRSASAVRDHLHDRTRHVVLRAPGDFLVLAIEHAGHVIGDVSLHLRTTAPETRTVEIGWLQLTTECGHGYATEAAAAMLQLAFDHLRATLVTAVIDSANANSARLARRLGFELAASRGNRDTFILSEREWRAHAAAVSAHPTRESIE